MIVVLNWQEELKQRVPTRLSQPRENFMKARVSTK